MGFLAIYLLAEVQPSILLFQTFLTLKAHPYLEGWWYMAPQRGAQALIKKSPSSVWVEGMILICIETLN